MGSAISTDAQTFNSTSDGSDGALILSRPDPDPNPDDPFIIEFNPTELNIDQDGDGIFHFTTITIDEGVTVRLTEKYLNGPVFWLATGTVVINGIIDLNGEAGKHGQDILNKNDDRIISLAGAGGFSGGIGAFDNNVADFVPSPAQSGKGSGGGLAKSRGGAGAGHSGSGGSPWERTNAREGGAGSEYGNNFLIPLIGGSGGAGGNRRDNQPGGTGGAGGGAILIVSSSSITIDGTIQANGGRGGNSGSYAGGGGSGGAIRLMSPVLNGSGTLRTLGGGAGTGRVWDGSGSIQDQGHGGNGSKGRIRFETFQEQFSGSSDPAASKGNPYRLFLPETLPPSLKVTSIAGNAIDNPSASFTLPDATIETAEPIEIKIEAKNVPIVIGETPTTVKIHIISENKEDQIIESPALSGTNEQSTTTVSVTLPSGYSRGFVSAKWE